MPTFLSCELKKGGGGERKRIQSEEAFEKSSEAELNQSVDG